MKRLSCFILFLVLFLGAWLNNISAQITFDGACAFNVAGGDCAEGCHCWSITMNCYDTGYECATSGGNCDYGDVTIAWEEDTVCDGNGICFFC